MKRRTVLALLALPLASQLALPDRAIAQVGRPTTLHVTQTYLRAKPGKRAALIRYIEQNWFAMDGKGIQRGLFTSYSLLDRSDDEKADWDIIVSVGYPTAAGHDAPGVADAFKAIRAAHREILVDGQNLKSLGTIVRHHTHRLVSQNP